MAVKLLDEIEKPHGVLQSQLSQSWAYPAGIKHANVSRGQGSDSAETLVSGVPGELRDTFFGGSALLVCHDKAEIWICMCYISLLKGGHCGQDTDLPWNDPC